MHRPLALYVAVFIAVSVAALPILTTTHSTTVTGTGSYGLNIGYVYFELQAGQSVDGWFIFSDTAVASGNSPYFVIRDPAGWELNATNSVNHNYGSEGKHETFAFTAKISGNWSAYVTTVVHSAGPFNYSYTVGPTPILGLGRLDFVGWVIAGGVVTELAVFLYFKRKPTKK